MAILDAGSISFEVKFDPAYDVRKDLMREHDSVELLMGESMYAGQIESVERIGDEMSITLTDVRKVK